MISWIIRLSWSVITRSIYYYVNKLCNCQNPKSMHLQLISTLPHHEFLSSVQKRNAHCFQTRNPLTFRARNLLTIFTRNLLIFLTQNIQFQSYLHQLPFILWKGLFIYIICIRGGRRGIKKLLKFPYPSLTIYQNLKDTLS